MDLVSFLFPAPSAHITGLTDRQRRRGSVEGPPASETDWGSGSHSLEQETSLGWNKDRATFKTIIVGTSLLKLLSFHGGDENEIWIAANIIMKSNLKHSRWENIIIALRAWQMHGGQGWKKDLKDAGRTRLCLAPGMGRRVILAPIRWKGWMRGRQA